MALITDLTKLYPLGTRSIREQQEEAKAQAGLSASKIYREQPQYGAKVAAIASKIRGEPVQPRRGLKAIYADELLKSGLAEEAMKVKDEVGQEEKAEAQGVIKAAQFFARQGNGAVAEKILKNNISLINKAFGVQLDEKDISDESIQYMNQAVDMLREIGFKADPETGDISIPDEVKNSVRGQAKLLDIYKVLLKAGKLGEKMRDRIEKLLLEPGEQENKIITWQTPSGEMINLRPGEMPPQGSVKISGKSLRENISDTDDYYQKLRAEYLAEHPGTEEIPPDIDKDLYLKAVEKVKRESVGVTTSKKAEKLRQKRLNDYRVQAHEAYNKLAIIDGMKYAMQNVKTGALTPLATRLGAYLKYFGIPVEGLSEAQLMGSLQRYMAMLLRNPKGGGGLPGNTSDKDVDFLLKAFANLEYDPEANRMITRAFERIEKRKIKIAEMIDDYEATGKIPDATLEKQINDYLRNTPIYPEAYKPGDIFVMKKDGRTIRKKIAAIGVDDETGEVKAFQFKDGTIKYFDY